MAITWKLLLISMVSSARCSRCQFRRNALATSDSLRCRQLVAPILPDFPSQKFRQNRNGGPFSPNFPFKVSDVRSDSEQHTFAQNLAPTLESNGGEGSKKQSQIGAWIQAIRPKTLSASLMPVMVGHALAYCDYRMADIAVSALFWAFAVLTQIGTNLHNDYADFIRGADTDKRIGPARATQKGWIKPRNMAKASTIVLAISLAIGVKLVALGGLPIALSVASCIFGAFAYTGGPYPLGYIGLGKLSIAYAGLGDIFTMFYFGFVPVLSTYWLNTGRITSTAIGFAIAMGSFASAIITVNNIRDVEDDRRVGKKTSAVRFGVNFARREYSILMLTGYVILPLMWASGMIPATWMLPLVTLLAADYEIRDVNKNEGRKLNKSLFGTAKVQILYTAFQLLGMYASERVRQASYDLYARLVLTYDPMLAAQLKLAIFIGAVYYHRKQKGQDPLYPYAADDDMD